MLQVIAAFMMVDALNKKGYNGYLLSIPSFNDLKHIYSIAAPVFVTMISKVCNSIACSLSVSNNYESMNLIQIEFLR